MDGKHVLVGDQEAQKAGAPETTVIYVTNGAGGRILRKIRLKGSTDVGEFILHGKTIVGANSLGGSTSGGNVLFFNYPAGGTAIKTIHYTFGEPIGTAISGN